MSAKGRAILRTESKSQDGTHTPALSVLLPRESPAGKRQSGGQQIRATEKRIEESKSPEGAHSPPLSASLPQESSAGRRESEGQQTQATEQGMQDRLSTLMVVTTLIVTVTFGAGFTAPGGLYGSDDPDPRNRGMAILGHKFLFKLFVVLNTVAMYSSTFGSYLLLGILIGKFRLFKIYGLAQSMVSLSLLLMILEFMAAASLVVSNIRWLAGFIIYLGIVSSTLLQVRQVYICFS